MNALKPAFQASKVILATPTSTGPKKRPIDPCAPGPRVIPLDEQRQIVKQAGGLRGSRNQCPVCGVLFNSQGGFDEHKTGKVGTPQRRCLTTEELERVGMWKGADGFWRREKQGDKARTFGREKGAK